MRKGMRRFFKNEKGQAVIELAITLPILLLVLCGIIDFGWIFSNKMLVIYNSREGARYGSLVATETNATTLITTRVIDTTPEYLQDEITVVVTFSNPTDIRSGDVEVEVSCSIKALTPLTGIFIKDQTILLESSCVMKIE